MTEEAIENVEDPDLKALLLRHRDTVLSASGFPDFGNAAESLPRYKDREIMIDAAHGPEFLESYTAYIKDNFDPPYSDCERLIAHMMGSAAHSLEDQTYDEIFMRKAFMVDLETDDLWEYDLDTGADIILITKYGRWLDVPHYHVPARDLVHVYEAMGLEVSRAELRAGSRMHKAGHVGERLIAPFLHRKYAREIPWTADNVVTHAGGIKYHGPLVARYWENLWSLLNEDNDRFELLLGTFPDEGGSIPADAYVSVFFNRGINRDTITTETFILKDSAGKIIPGSIRFEGGNVASYLPDPVLRPGATYTYVLTTGIKDITGAPLDEEHVGTFSATEQEGFWRLHQPSPKNYRVIRF